MSQFFTCFNLHLSLFARKVIIKAFWVLSFMYCIVLSIMLFSNGEWKWCSIFKNWHAWGGYQVPPSQLKQNVDHILLQYVIENALLQNILLSFDISIARISLSFGSIIAHSQIYSEDPTLIKVSSIIYPSIFLFFLVNIFFGLYFCIYIPVETWLL